MMIPQVVSKELSAHFLLTFVFRYVGFSDLQLAPLSTLYFSINFQNHDFPRSSISQASWSTGHHFEFTSGKVIQCSNLTLINMKIIQKINDVKF